MPSRCAARAAHGSRPSAAVPAQARASARSCGGDRLHSSPSSRCTSAQRGQQLLQVRQGAACQRRGGRPRTAARRTGSAGALRPIIRPAPAPTATPAPVASPPHELHPLPRPHPRRMNLPYEWQIGWRYTRAGRAGRRNGFISFISGVSMLGIALGVAALIIVLSVMNGFQKEVRDRMLSVIAHIEVFDAGGGALPDWHATAAAAQRDPRVHRRRAVRLGAGAGGPRRRAARRRGARHRPGRGSARSPSWRARRQPLMASCSRAHGTSCSASSWRACSARASATR